MSELYNPYNVYNLHYDLLHILKTQKRINDFIESVDLMRVRTTGLKDKEVYESILKAAVVWQERQPLPPYFKGEYYDKEAKA